MKRNALLNVLFSTLITNEISQTGHKRKIVLATALNENTFCLPGVYFFNLLNGSYILHLSHLHTIQYNNPGGLNQAGIEAL